jgi:GTP 3',8-cyclase
MITSLRTDSSPSPGEAAVDQFGRRIRYLRISLTETCNLRCIYCMPEFLAVKPTQGMIRDEEILRFVGLFAGIGFDKFRLTGGEPTLRRGILDLVHRIARTPGVREVAMTTNGMLLQPIARSLAKAGLKRINIRLDTLDGMRFRQMSRRGNLDRVWAGVLAADAANLAIKLNTVVVRGFNDRRDAVELARLTTVRPWQVRFIEVMPIGRGASLPEDGVVSQEELMERISAELGALTPVNDGQMDGEARVYRLAGAPGTIGFISSVTQPFCHGCDRARLTADGHLRLCLLRENEADLLGPMRRGATDAELETLIRESIRAKPLEHGLAKRLIPLNRIMSEIGG